MSTLWHTLATTGESYVVFSMYVTIHSAELTIHVTDRGIGRRRSGSTTRTSRWQNAF